MSSIGRTVKGFVNTLLGVSDDQDDDFIFFWEDEDEIVHRDEQGFSVSEGISNYRTEISMSLAAISVIVSLIFINSEKRYAYTVPLFFAITFLVASLYFVQTQYKDPLDLITDSMEKLKNWDFTGASKYLYSPNLPDSVENLETFRSSIAGLSTTLDSTTMKVMNGLFVVEDKFRSIQSSISNISSYIDNQGLSTANYQEIKYYTSEVSLGVDTFTSVFDDSLHSNEDVVAVIKSIGKQINMLALNAGIEAARAGEYGSGFEVVSNNLRRLSQHAVSTTTDMKVIKGNINTDAREALEKITQSMNSLTLNIDNSYSSITSINSELFQVKDDLETLSTSIAAMQELLNSMGSELQKIRK